MVAMVTTGRQRSLAWVSTIPHWLYFTALRTNQSWWTNTVVWGAVLACVNQSRPQDLYVDQVAVDPAWRGQGVTKLLLDAVEAAGRARGCTRLWLSTDPLNPAVRAWPPLGFSSLGVRRDFKGAGKDREVFEKRL